GVAEHSYKAYIARHGPATDGSFTVSDLESGEKACDPTCGKLVLEISRIRLLRRNNRIPISIVISVISERCSHRADLRETLEFLCRLACFAECGEQDSDE